LEAQRIENLQRRDVHPLEEARGFKALLNLEDPKYSIEQIAAKVGKSPAYCAARVRVTELAVPVVEAFYAEEIGVGHHTHSTRVHGPVNIPLCASPRGISKWSAWRRSCQRRC
jgi:ParB/RepB/Spo0J family partition protein